MKQSIFRILQSSRLETFCIYIVAIQVVLLSLILLITCFVPTIIRIKRVLRQRKRKQLMMSQLKRMDELENRLNQRLGHHVYSVQQNLNHDA